MPSGVLNYWNGRSGWARPIGAENLPTVQARDVFVMTANMLVASSANLFSSAINSQLVNATVSYSTTSTGDVVALAVTLS